MDLVKGLHEIFRHAAAGFGQNTGLFIELTDLLRREGAVVPGLGPKCNVHGNNVNVIALGQFGGDIRSGLGHQNNGAFDLFVHIQPSLSLSSG